MRSEASETSQGEVFEAFGAVAYNVQAFEYTLSNLLAQVYSAGPDQLTRSQVVELTEGNYKKTLGRLGNALRKALPNEHPLGKLVMEAVARRNFLMHNYFRERIDDMKTSEGRTQVILELRQDQRLFQERDAELMQVYQNWLLSHGITSGGA
jgi:hypothetical protein